MQNNFLTNDQKLDYVYEVTRIQEAQRKRAFWWWTFRRVFILGAVVFFYSNAPYFVGKFTEMIQPIVMDQATKMMDGKKEELLEKAREFIQE